MWPNRVALWLFVPILSSREQIQMGHVSSDRARLAFACVVLVAVVAVLAIAAFPLGFLDGAAAFWRYPKGDFAQHIIGGRYFIADAWRWPLLIVPDLGLPPGTNIGLTDSIPLVALAAKLTRGWYGYLRPYLPLWIFFCYLAQGPACAIGLYVLGVRNVPALIIGGLIAVFTPVLLFRFGHAALCAQFLLLLGLAVHLQLAREASRRVVILLPSTAPGRCVAGSRLSLRDDVRDHAGQPAARTVDRAPDDFRRSGATRNDGGGDRRGYVGLRLFGARADSDETLWSVAARSGRSVFPRAERCFWQRQTPCRPQR